MAAITTRQTAGIGATVAGVPLTNAQLDQNFININTDLSNAVYLSTAQTITGIKTFSNGLITGSTSYPSYSASIDFGSDVGGTWRKIITVSSPNVQYSTIGFKIEVTDPQANHATTSSPDNIITHVYWVACVRTNDTVLDTPDSCYVRGPGSLIRAVKTSTGNYEIQVQCLTQYRELTVDISVYAVNGAHTVTYSAGTTASTGTVQYNAAIGTYTDWFGNISATGTGYVGGLLTANSGIYRATGNGVAYWLQQDGTGRNHWYWNTSGGTSPTFSYPGEDASALTINVTGTGAGGAFFHRSASGVGKLAGDAISWTTTIYSDINTFTWKGNTVWHSGNDGVGSGLDADLLDGQSGSYYTTAGNLTGTIPTAVLGNSSFNIGTTSIALNRASAVQSLTGVSIDGNAGTVTNGVYTTGSYSNPSWITSLSETKVLPSQTGNTGKYLTTDGNSTSWATVTLPSGQTAGSATAGYLQYSGTTATAGQINGGTTAPTNTTRLNYEGNLYATNFFGNGSNLTSLTAGNLSGTIPSAVLANSSLFIGTTSVALNRASASLSLAGVSIDGNAGTVTNGVYTTGDQSIAGVKTLTGPLVSPRLNIERVNNTASGISWYNRATYTSWADYMAQAAQTSVGPTGNITAPTGTLVTSWGLRRFIENVAGYGWTWESGTSAQTTPTVVAEIRSSDGAARFGGVVTAPNFADSTGTYNVNFGTGGSEGRGVGAGYSGGSYGGIGYNIRHTATSDSYIAPSTDTVSYLRFDTGGFRFFSSAAGTAGRALSLTTGNSIAFLSSTGNLSVSGNITATGTIVGDFVVSVINTNTTAVHGTVYILTASLTLTLPASPTVGDWVRVSNRSGTTTCVIARNGSNIMSLAEDMTVDTLNATLTLVYASATLGWTLI